MASRKNPTLAEVGELATIAEIIKRAPSRHNGDDAAVLDHGAPNSRTVVTTDMLVEGRHFKLDWSTPAEIGKKAITQNFADVEAMGARPVAVLLALSVPSYTRLEFVTELARGMGERLQDYGAELVGGDITDGESIVVAITAVGQLGGSLAPLTLDAARAGQKLVASGPIGESAAGYALLRRFGREGVPEEFWPLVQAHCAATMAPGRGFVARSAGASAMTDNSDGLISDLTTIAQRSGVSIDLDSSAIAPSQLMQRAAERLECDPWEWTLSGGEDHTLLATVFGAAPTGFREIGTVGHKDHLRTVTIDGKLPAYNLGWKSF